MKSIPQRLYTKFAINSFQNKMIIKWELLEYVIRLKMSVNKYLNETSSLTNRFVSISLVTLD